MLYLGIGDARPAGGNWAVLTREMRVTDITADPASGLDATSAILNLGWLVFGPHFHAALISNPLLPLALLLGRMVMATI